MKTENLVLRDSEEVEKYFVETTGMKPGFFQLSSGVINLQLHTVDLDGVSLIWTRSQGRQRWQDVMLDGGALHFGIAIECAGPITNRGRDINADEAQVWIPGEEMDLVMQGPLLSLDIGVEASLVEELGWCFVGEPLRKVPRKYAARLINTSRRATFAGLESENAGRSSAIESKTMFWREQVLNDLEPVLQSWLSDNKPINLPPFPGTRDYQLLNKAESFFDSFDNSEPFKVDLLAKSLDIPRRTIFHAFRTTIGVGPRRYFELKRLHALRLQLRQATGQKNTVTKIADGLGFTETGRLSGIYRRHFGEYPSETLKRA